MRTKPYLLFAMIGFLGVVALLISTRWGSLWHLDSTAYIDAARNVVQGLGLVIYEGAYHPWVHHPPFIPLLLAGTEFVTGIDPMYFGWYLDAILLTVNAFLVGHLLFKATSKLSWSLLGMILVGFAPWNLETHATVFSEPLFLFFMLTSLHFVWRYLESGAGKYLVISAILANFGVLTRYSGAALIIAAVVCILLLNRSASLKNRIYHAVVYLVVSCPLIAAWLVFTVVTDGGLGHRSFGFYPRVSGYYLGIIDTFTVWLSVDALPRVIRYGIVLIVGLLLGAILLRFLRVRRTEAQANPSPYRLFQMAAVYAGSYGAFIFVSHLFYDPDLWLSSQRILLPFYYLLVVILLTAAAFAAGRTISKYGSMAVRLAGPAISILFTVQGLRWLSNTGVWITDTGNTGKYPYQQQWFNSPTIARLQTLSPEIPIYSFEPVLIYMMVERNAFGLDAAKPDMPSLAVVFDQPFTFTFERTTPIPLPIETYFPASDYRLTLLYDEADGQIYQIDPVETS